MRTQRNWTVKASPTAMISSRSRAASAARRSRADDREERYDEIDVTRQHMATAATSRRAMYALTL